MPRIYNVEMTTRQRDLVISMIQLLTRRLELPVHTITYRELAEELGTSYRKLGQPLIKMARVLSECDVCENIPSLNALVVYSLTLLPSREGLANAYPGANMENDEELRQLMVEMNNRARAFNKWNKVIDSIIANAHD